MNLNLDNKVALVTGSSKGIGREIARKFLKEGSIVYINGRNIKILTETFTELQCEFGERVRMFRGDLTSNEAIRDLVNLILMRERRLDIVVANIGLGSFQSGWDTDDDLWNYSFELNFMSSMRIARETIRIMKAQETGGNIIIISSIAGVEDISAPLAYSVAKSALLAYTNQLSRLVAPFRIRVNSVSPGNVYFNGGTWERKEKDNSEEVIKYIQNVVPLKRFGLPEEISDMVCFLASSRSAFTTGANFIVDGGQVRTI